MKNHGQFCSIARALDVVGGRWTLLVVRELIGGSRRFNDIRRGVPRMSQSVLTERLQALADAGLVTRAEGRRGPEYELTPAGAELGGVLKALGVWGQRWLPRWPEARDPDLTPVLADMARRVRAEALPEAPLVVRIEMAGSRRPSFLLLSRREQSLCGRNPGFPEPVVLGGEAAALAAWWRGDLGFEAARRSGLRLEAPPALARAFPGWFERYLFADTPSQLVATVAMGAA